jgi:ABC-type nitrate/sulfonate/bicarbonate transport system substrate-binding protein
MRRNLARGVIQIGVAVAVAVLSATLPASAQTKLVVGKANSIADTNIPVNIGERLGIFKKRGLDLQIVDFQGGGKLVQAMIAGDIDIGVGAGVEMAYIARGTPMMAICESASAMSSFAIGVPWDSPLKSLDDLKGKKVGVSGAGSLTDWLAKQLTLKQGWGPDGIIIAPIGSNPTTSAAAFRAHLIDAYVGGTATFLRMAESQSGRILAPVSSYMGPLAAGMLFASKRVMDSHPDAVRAFVAGWVETIGFIRDHKAEAVKLAAAVTHFSEAVMAQDYDIVIGMYTKDCRFDARSLEALRQSFLDLKLLDEAPDMTKLYTEAYLPK